MGKTRKRKQRGGVDLAKTIEKVQRMDVQIDAMTQKINGLKALLQEPMTPIPDSAFRLPAPLPSVAAVPPHLRGQKTPVLPPSPPLPEAPKPEAPKPSHSPLTRQGAFKETREATLPPAQPAKPPAPPLLRQGALKEIPGVPRANRPPEGTVKALATQIEAKKPMPPPPFPLVRQGALRSIPGVPKPRRVTFRNKPNSVGVNRRSLERNYAYTRNLEESRKSMPKSSSRGTIWLNEKESQIYASVVADYNTASNMIKALEAKPNVSPNSVRKIAKKIQLNYPNNDD